MNTVYFVALAFHLILERDTRFELVLSAWKAVVLAVKHQSRKFGSLERNRTLDLSVISRLLDH